MVASQCLASNYVKRKNRAASCLVSKYWIKIGLSEKKSVNVSALNKTRYDEFHFRSLRLDAAWRKKRMVNALTSDSAREGVNGIALCLIISALVDSLLRAIQNCNASRKARAMLQLRYAGKSLDNRLAVLSSLLIIKLRREEKMMITMQIRKQSFMDGRNERSG